MGEGCVTIDFAGEAITLMPERAAWWASRGMVIVADLHLGKSEAMRLAGVPVPDVDLDEQFERLERVVASTGAERVVIAGDLIHAHAGLTAALTDRVGARLESLRARGVGFTLVRGNHDRRIDAVERAWGLLDIRDEMVEEGIRIVHEPVEPGEGEGVIAGHLHPALSVGGVKVPAFVVAARRLTLPAFSRFTAGGRVASEQGMRWYPIADGCVIAMEVRGRSGERGVALRSAARGGER
ncbi:MAG: ligase-associated DNA damage response endonuclease PdeM [Phycisphaeraceae bacterium]|nr:ligase-associated DNA damage response endonuclease PdeM [Phycisphaeraceae bacterium]MBX3367397.1 ligase-associated DNA damage response endonuclease PdeM [Phycisphaeraceae bacterium]